MTISKINAINAYSSVEKTIPKKEIQETKELSRIEELKKQIENGSYKLDMSATAKKIAESLI